MRATVGLLLLAGAATAADDCVVLDAPGASSIEVRSLDGTLMGNGTEVCLPDAHYRITLEAETCPQLTCLVPTAVPTPTPSSKPTPAPSPAPTPEPSLNPTTETPAPSPAPSVAPTPAPSSQPTTAAPSSRPTQAPCSSSLCWSDQTTGAIDCGALSGAPLIGEAPWDPSLNEYSTPQLSKLGVDGAWDSSSELSSVLNDHGAVALKVATSAVFSAGSDAYVLGTLEKQLCRLGESDIVCFAGELMAEPSAATTYGTSFYYLSTDTIYRVTSLANEQPIFGSAGLSINAALLDGTLDAIAAIEMDDASYLVGLASSFKVLVVRLHPDTHAPATYSILDSTVDWGSSTEHSVTFAGAYGFDERALFAAAEGGLFEVSLSSIPDACWHADASASLCSATVDVTRLADSDTYEGLGLNCPGVFSLLDSEAPTAAPTYPECHDLICWDTDITPWNCDQQDGPAALVKTTSGDYTHWSIARHDDAWELAEDLPAAVSYDAAGLLEGDDGFYALAAVNRSLCRFDETSVECFSGLLRTKPSAGTVLGSKYYYSSSTTLYHVSQIHTDVPSFEDVGFSLPFSVGDWVAVDEALHGETLVGDGQGSTAYLIGVSETLEIVAVTLSSEGLPTSYATVQGSGATGPFNAGWAIYDEEEEATRIVFAGSDGVYEVPAFSTTDTSVALIRVGDAVTLDVYDGLSCPQMSHLSDVFESRAPTEVPTTQPSLTPSSVPSSKPTNPTVAPSLGCVARGTSSCSGPSTTISQFDCLNGNAFHSSTADGSNAIYGYNLALQSGGYDFVFGPGTSIDALGVLELSDGAWLFGASQNKLCAFNSGESACFSTSLVNQPDAGVVTGTSYYYARSLGDGDQSIHFVQDIHSDAPTFVTDANTRLVIAEEASNGVKLFAGVIGDLASTESIDDGKTDRTYLVGLGQRFEVLVVRLAADGYPEAYAVLDSTHTIDPDTYGIDEEEHEFGSAFSYNDGVFFGGDDGIGVFQLSLPLTVPTSCWNTGTSVSTHAACDGATASLAKVRDLALTGSGVDGFNCPSFDALGRAPTPAPVAARRLASTCAYYVDWGTCSVSSGALTVSGSLRLAGFAAAECSVQWLSVLTRTIANALSVADDAVTNVACGSRRRRLAASDSSVVTYDASLDASTAPADVSVASALIEGNATALQLVLANTLETAFTPAGALDAALDSAASSLSDEGVALDGVQLLLNRTVTANCFEDCSITSSGGGSSRNKKKNALWWLTDLKIILPVCAGLLLILVGVLYRKRQTSQKDSEEAKHDEGVAERRLRFDEEDLAVEERKEAPSSDDDVEAPPTPAPAPPLPPRSRDHTTPRRRVEEVDDPRSPRPNRSPVPMTWGDVDKAGGLPARSPAPPTPVLYLGDEDDADDGSAFGDDDVVPPPPPPLPSELSTARPEPSVPRPPRTEEYFGANVYERSPRPDEPGGRLFI
jgi:hypothetical protein